APSRPSAVLPPVAAAPRGRSPLGSHRPCPLSLPLHGGDVRLASLDFSPSLLGEWHEVPRGRGPQDRWETAGCLMARFARAPSRGSAFLPPGATAPRGSSPLGSHRPCPLSLPLHGGGVRLASLDFSPSLLGEWHEVPRGRGPQDRWETPGCLMARFARAPS